MPLQKSARYHPARLCVRLLRGLELPPPTFEANSPYELKQSALDGFMWLTVGNGARAVLKVAVLAVLARLLGPETFGLLAAAGVVIWSAMIFSNLGVAPALVQRRDLLPSEVGTAFVASAAFGTVAGVVVFLGAALIAEFFRMPALAAVIQALAVLFPLTGIALVSESLLQKALRFDLIARAELASYAVGYGLVGIVLACLGWGVWALVAAELCKAALKTALFLGAAPVPRFAFEASVLRQLLRFGSRYTASSVCGYLGAQSDSLVIGRFLGAAALGAYGRAFELMVLPAQALGVMLEKILFPTLARVQGEQAHLQTAYRRCTALVALIVLPVGVFTVLLAPEIVRALLGPGWEEAVVPLQILAVAMYFRVGYMVGLSVAHAIGAAGEAAWRNALYAGLTLLGALVGQQWGLPGVAGAVVLAITVNFLLVLQLGIAITGIKLIELVRLHARAALLALIVGFEAWVTAVAFRAAEVPALVTLIGAALVVGVSALALIASPRLLGPEGVWIVQTFQGYLRSRLKPLISGTPSP